MSLVTPSLTYWPNPNTGKPLFNGYVYVGEPDTDPEIALNQKQVTLRLEDGTTLNVGQPLRLSEGGVLQYNGSYAVITVEGDYSIKALDRRESQAFYIPNNSGLFDASQISINIGSAETNVSDYLNAIKYHETISDAISLSSSDLQILVESNQNIRTKYNNIISKDGGAEYQVLESSDYSGTPDGYGDHYAGGGTSYVLKLAETEPTFCMFGAVGDCEKSISGVTGMYVFAGTDDSLNIQAAFNYGPYIVSDHGKHYNLNEEVIDVPHNITWECDNTSSMNNGELDIRENDGENLTIGDLLAYDINLRVGSVSSSSPAKNVNIRSVNIEGNGKYNLLFIDNLTHGNIRINMLPDDGVTRQQAMGIGGLWYSTIDTIHLSGYYSMGFETITREGYALRNTTINKLISDRNEAAVSQAGEHGFYVRHSYDSYIGSVYSTGYPLALAGVSNCFKFRDCWKCRVGPVVAYTINIASDGNSDVFNSLEDNVIESIDTRVDIDDQDSYGDIRFTTNSPGFMSGNVIQQGLYSSITTSGDLLTQTPNWNIKGTVVLANEGNLQLDDLYFVDADITWLYADTYEYNRTFRAINCTINDRIQVSNQNIELTRCHAMGDVRLSSTSTLTTQEINLYHCTVEGSVVVNSTDGRLVDSIMVNTTILSDRSGNSNFRPDGTITYRSVFYNNGYYLDESVFNTY